MSAADSCGRPAWVGDFAWQAHQLTLDPKVREKFGMMLRRWHVEQGELAERISRGHSERRQVWIDEQTQEEHVYTPTAGERPDLHGPPPFCFGPKLSVGARYAVAGAVHDFCIERVRARQGEHVAVLNPWGVDLSLHQAGLSLPPLQEDDDRGFVLGGHRWLCLLRMTMPRVTQDQEGMIRDCNRGGAGRSGAGGGPSGGRGD